MAGEVGILHLEVVDDIGQHRPEQTKREAWSFMCIPDKKNVLSIKLSNTSQRRGIPR